jgi:cyclic pyranopterin phosphate synthase
MRLMGMIDVTDKPVVHRMAEAAGKIHLSPETIEVIQTGKVKKGDPLLVAEVAQARTGVEMEALVGVSIALDTLWDMVKYLEKNAEGQYPHTRISDIRVIQKRKEP